MCTTFICIYILWMFCGKLLVFSYAYTTFTLIIVSLHLGQSDLDGLYQWKSHDRRHRMYADKSNKKNRLKVKSSLNYVCFDKVLLNVGVSDKDYFSWIWVLTCQLTHNKYEWLHNNRFPLVISTFAIVVKVCSLAKMPDNGKLGPKRKTKHFMFCIPKWSSFKQWF